MSIVPRYFPFFEMFTVLVVLQRYFKMVPMDIITESGQAFPRPNTGLKITAGQRTMSGLIEALTGQTFDLPVM